MASRLNEMLNEGLVVIGRPVANEWTDHEKVKEVAAAVDAWGKKLSLPLGLIYCGTTINWPDDVEWTPIVIGLVTFDGYGDDDDPTAGEVPPEAMDLSRGDAIPAEFFSDMEQEHGVEFSGELDVLLAAAGWTWTDLVDENGDRVCAVSTEDAGYRSIPEKLRGKSWTMRVGYC